jgi:hypothetical protein
METDPRVCASVRKGLSFSCVTSFSRQGCCWGAVTVTDRLHAGSPPLLRAQVPQNPYVQQQQQQQPQQNGPHAPMGPPPPRPPQHAGAMGPPPPRAPGAMGPPPPRGLPQDPDAGSGPCR